MDTSKVLSELRAERDRINHAIAALEALGTNSSRAASRVEPTREPAHTLKGGKHTMSPVTRKRLSLAAKKRWAEKKNSAPPQATAQPAPKPVAAKQAKKRTISAAGRRRIAAAAKKMWVERKKKAAKAPSA